MGNLQRHKLQPHVQLRTVDDYAVMSMVESGLGLSILPGLILRRIPYKLAIRPLDVPASRTLGLALRKDAPTPLSGLSPLPRRKTGPTVLTAEPVHFYGFFRDVRPLPGGS